MAEVLMVLAILAGVAIALLHHLWLIGDRLDDAAARLLWRPQAAQIDTGAEPTPGLTPLVEGCDAARTGADRARAARRLAGGAAAAHAAPLPAMFDPVSDEVLARYRRFAGDLAAARR